MRIAKLETVKLAMDNARTFALEKADFADDRHQEPLNQDAEITLQIEAALGDLYELMSEERGHTDPGMTLQESFAIGHDGG